MIPEQTLRAAEAIDFVARNEFDFTLQEIAQGGRSRESPG